MFAEGRSGEGLRFLGVESLVTKVCDAFWLHKQHELLAVGIVVEQAVKRSCSRGGEVGRAQAILGVPSDLTAGVGTVVVSSRLPRSDFP